MSKESSQRRCHQLETDKLDLFGHNVKIGGKKKEKKSPLLLLSLTDYLIPFSCYA